MNIIANRLLPAMALLAAASTGCASAPPLNAQIEALGGERLQILWLHAYPDKMGVRLQGHVRRPARALLPLPGHLHIVGCFADGAPPLIVDSRWTRIPARADRMAPFTALLPTGHPERIERIIVEYRSDARDEEQLQAPARTSCLGNGVSP